MLSVIRTACHIVWKQPNARIRYVFSTFAKETFPMAPSKRFLLRFALCMFLLTIVGRGLGLLYSEASTNIAYADWFATLLGYVKDLLSCLRTTLLFCSVVYGYWTFGLAFSNGLICVCGGMILLDMISRFAADLATSSITDIMTVALIWLALQFAYELILCILAWITAQCIHHLCTTSTHPRASVRYTCQTALRLSLLWQFLTRIGMEIYDIMSFTNNYTNITGAEISSMAGYLLYAIILYGGVAFLIEECLYAIWKKHYEKSAA